MPKHCIYKRRSHYSYKDILDLAMDIAKNIDEGDLLPGDRLVPIGELAVALGVHPSVVGGAYRYLVDMGVIEIHGGSSGHRVSGGTLLESPGFRARAAARRTLEALRIKLEAQKEKKDS